jgi:hypothetical protein
LSSSPKAGACQQDEAENQVAGGDIDGFRRKVNGQAHDPEKLVLDLIGDGNRFSDKIMRQEKAPGGWK